MNLTKAALLTPKTRTVELPEGTITIRQLSAGYAIALRGKDLRDEEIFDLLAHSICDPELTTAEVAQIPIAQLQPIVDAVLEFNSITEGKAENDLKKTLPSALPIS